MFTFARFTIYHNVLFNQRYICSCSFQMNMEASLPTSPTAEKSFSSDDFPSPPSLSPPPPPPPPQSESSAATEEQDFPAPPPPPSATDFPAPPTLEETMPGEEPPQTPQSARETLSFDNPLANIPVDSKNEAISGKQEEGDFDFTDADAAIDKMLDDLADFQDVSRNLCIGTCV